MTSPFTPFCSFTLWVAAILLHPAPAAAQSTRERETRCSALALADFHGVEDAPTQVVSARAVAATPSMVAHCDVKGYVAPNVGFELLLPFENWNGKFLQLGSGGHAGQTNPGACAASVRRGYACLTSNLGHEGTGGDGVWAIGTLQARVDWGYRATHVVTLGGKAVTARFFGRAPAPAYFMGCSTGGRQALQEAQRFPWDYDGIVAGAPPIRLADLYVTFAWGQLAARDSSGALLLALPDLALLTHAALELCDRGDGLSDGVIGDPAHCAFRPSVLACRPGQTSGCLGPAQIRAAERIYSGPTTRAGKSLFGAGAAPGSELGSKSDQAIGGNWAIYYTGNGSTPALYSRITENGLRYVFRDGALAPSWTIKDFDFDQDYKRLDVMESLYDSSNPDLGRFKEAGGKLLIYHGLNDLSILPQWITAYYQKVEAVMGGPKATQEFARLFQLPGVEHCAGGPGADVVDYLSAIEQWVERGRAPEKLLAYHLKDSVATSPREFPIPPAEIEFSRPVYPYPLVARYRGQGEPSSAENFAPVMPKP